MRHRYATVALLCAVAGLHACRSDRGSNVPVTAETTKGRFPHEKHKSTRCIECHALDSVLAGKPARPGAANHAPCDRNQCHRDKFLQAPSSFCTMCHSRVNVALEGATTPAPYPPVRGPRSLAARFSHAVHLDYARMEDQVGFHVSCTDCHKLGKTRMQEPGHAVCSRCHAEESAPANSPTLRNCDGCHQPRRKKPSRLRTLIRGDLRFRHARHRTDRRGKLILCTECHSKAKQAVSPTTHIPPTTATCVACHDNNKRVPLSRRMRECATCHTTRTRTISAIAPRSHLPPRDRPADHTLAFRKDHATDARRDTARCARCHTFMSGSKRAACDQCHQVMRPGDHVVTWREFEHGPAAATRADRCTVCHAGEFCSSCHSKAPRSHMPLALWRMGGHGSLARLNMRSCITCHTVARDCANCHRVRRP